jgi:hypothetical protein
VSASTAETITIDSSQVIGEQQDGARTAIGWDDLREIRVRASAGTGSGHPFAFELGAASSDLSVPLALTTDDFLKRLQALPGFDTGALIAGLSAPRDVELVCWRATGQGRARGRVPR